MQLINYTIFFLSFSMLSQESISTTLIAKTKLDIDTLVQINNFGALYYIKDNTFSIQNKNNTLNYSNVQLGQISSANAFNSLKTNVFYKDFSTVVVLDNRFTEIIKTNFNNLQPFRDITHVSTGSDNTIWVFNQNTQQLEVFDYITNKTRAKTLPIDGNVIALYSNYNFCWVVTASFMYCYNYFGSLISKTANNGFSALKENNGNLYLLKQNKLFLKAKNSSEIQTIKLPQLLIKQFFVTNETVYIYDGKFLYHYQLITN